MEQATDLFIEQLRKGNRAAYQRLVSDYGPAVFQMVRRIVVRQEDAEEVWQDVFVKALQGIGSYDSRKASLATWLSRIAYHESLNFMRKRQPDIVYMEDYDLCGIDESPEEVAHDSQTASTGASPRDASAPRAGRHYDVLLRQHEPRRHRLRHWLYPLYRRLTTEPYPKETLSNHQNHAEMNENDINRILRADDSLREAVRRREQRQPPMPAGLNERLMQRIEKEVPAKPENTRRQVWLWMAAASVAAIMIVLLMPPKENGDEAAPCSGEFAIRQNGVGDLKSPQAEKDHRITNPDTQDSRIAYSSELRTANSSELKAIAKSKTENKHKRKAAPRQELLLAVDKGTGRLILSRIMNLSL